jgi:winged helix DNA-binding protein
LKERVLTVRELNRALLARQLLLERRRLSPAAALERVGPLHAQGVESTYVNLWSRIEGFRREQLTRAIERGSVIRSRPLRATLHLTSARDYVLFHGAIRESRAEWWQRTTKHRYDARTIARAERVLREAAASPRPLAELVDAVGGDRFLAGTATIRLGVRTVAPAGTWGYHGIEDYVLGEPPADRETGMRRLVSCYFAAFGPGSIDDLCFWASVRKGEVTPILEDLDLRRFRDESGRLLLDLPRAPLPPVDTPAPPRFLLRWDNLYLGHASGERDRIVPPAFRKHVYTVNTVMPATFLVDGFVAGTWRYERGRVLIEPWRRLTKAEREALASESATLADFLSG